MCTQKREYIKITFLTNGKLMYKELLLGKEMNYRLMPSLELLALTRTVATLWNHAEIRFLIIHSYKSSEKVKDMEDKVIEKVLQLPQPKFLKKMIVGLIKPIGREIIKWMKYHNDRYLGLDLPSELFWSPQGTVDEKRTAEELIKDVNLAVTSRYKLACIYCLEDDIPLLWNKMPRGYKRFFYRKKYPRVNQEELVVFWTYYIKGEVKKWSNMIRNRQPERFTAYQYAFIYSVFSKNKVATAYFLEKLNYAEREECLVRFTGSAVNAPDYLQTISVHNFNVHFDFSNKDFCFSERAFDLFPVLVSQMDKEQQMEVFTKYPYYSLICFLDWPWQDFFMETAKRVCTFLEGPAFEDLLCDILEKVIDGYEDCDYQKMFRDFWRLSPVNLKRIATDEFGNITQHILLQKLLQAGDKESFKVVLEYLPTVERAIIFYDHGMYICGSLIYHDKRDLLKFFVQEIMSCKYRLIKEEFKEPVIRLIRDEDSVVEISYLDRNKLLGGLDALIQKYGVKRGLEEGDDSVAKKLCAEK